MRKLVNATYISLDGAIEKPHLWPSAGDDDGELGRIQTELLLECDVLIMGRRTYEGFAPVWPTRSGDPMSDHINTMKKYVVSSTLTDPEWTNTEVLSGDVIGEIRRLKDEPGKHIVQYGFGQLSHALLQHGLLDELRLWFHPLFVGSGGPQDLLYREGPLTKFQLFDNQTLKNGIVILSYRYAGRAEAG